jgi:hypothetical protein
MKWTFEVEVELDTNSSCFAMDWFEYKFSGMESIYYTEKTMNDLAPVVTYDSVCCHPTSDDNIQHITHDDPEELNL